MKSASSPRLIRASIYQLNSTMTALTWMNLYRSHALCEVARIKRSAMRSVGALCSRVVMLEDMIYHEEHRVDTK